MAEAIERPKSALDKAFEEFEKQTADCRVIRKELIDNLRKNMKFAEVHDYDKAMMVSAKMSMITTLNGMLKDVEDTEMKRVKMQLARKEQENGGQYSAAIVNLMKAIRADGRNAAGENAKSPEEIDAELKDQADKRGITISKDETTACEGLPSDIGNAEKPKTDEAAEPEKK